MSERPRLRRYTFGGHFVFDTLNCGEERYEWDEEDYDNSLHHRCSLPYNHEGNHKDKDFEWEPNEALDSELIAKWSAHD